MAQAKFTNFASSVIADVGGISAVTTVVNLLAGDGAKFPALSGGDWFYAVMFQKSGAAEINHEVVKVTARVGDALTIVRGQDGTTAKAFILGDSIEQRWVSACVDDERALNDSKDAALAASIAAVSSGARFQRFTAGGTWICPEGITSVMVEGCGGGGNGGAGGDGGGGMGGYGGGGGAGGSGARSTEILTVVPGTSYAITIGGAGNATSFDALKTWAAGSNGSDGGNYLTGTAGMGGAGGGYGQNGHAASAASSGVGGNNGGIGGIGEGGAGGAAAANTGLGGGGGAGGGTFTITGGAGGAGGSGFLNIWW